MGMSPGILPGEGSEIGEASRNSAGTLIFVHSCALDSLGTGELWTVYEHKGGPLRKLSSEVPTTLSFPKGMLGSGVCRRIH